MWVRKQCFRGCGSLLPHPSNFWKIGAQFGFLKLEVNSPNYAKTFRTPGSWNAGEAQAGTVGPDRP